LLVVVAIIAILIAILLPALGRARDQAKLTKCGANLKAWGEAVATYMAEYDGWFGGKPGGGYTGGQWDQDPAAFGIGPANPYNIQTYPSGVDPLNPGAETIGPSVYGSEAGHVLGAKARYCPADTPGNKGQPGVGYYGGRLLPGYKFGAYLPPPGSKQGSRYLVTNVKLFTDLADKLVMCDTDSANNYGDLAGVINHPGNQSIQIGINNTAAAGGPRNYNGIGWNTQLALQNRHNGKGNILFLDFHVDTHVWNDYVLNIPSIETDTDMSKNWTRFQLDQ
jgi:prepilin-type processing-associated H-X9-DG protein